MNWLQKIATEYLHPNIEKMIDYWDKKYPICKDSVSGLLINSDIPNTNSISSSMENWQELKGIRELPMSDFAEPKNIFYAANDFQKSRHLSDQIKHSKTISPLIIGIDKEGPYILEGVHRYVALHYINIPSFPALVIIDISDDNEWNEKEQKYTSVPNQWDKFQI